MRNVAFIAEEFAEQAFDHLRHRPPVVCIARREPDGEQFATVIRDQMQFEAKEPIDAGFTSAGASLKDLVRVNAAVMTDTQTGRINERDAAALPASGM